MIKKIIAISICFCFCLTSVAQAAPMVYTISVPEEYAKVTQRWKASKAELSRTKDDRQKTKDFSLQSLVGKKMASEENGLQTANYELLTDQKTVILIQDAHSNFSAQDHLAKTICAILPQLQQIMGTAPGQRSGHGSLGSVPTIPFIGIEGAIGEYDLKVLRDFPIVESKERVAADYVKAGKFIGAEYANIISEEDFTLFGLEDLALFKDNFHAFQSISQQQDAASATIQALEAYVAREKKKITTEALIQFNAELPDHTKNAEELVACLPVVISYLDRVGLDLYDYTHVAYLLESVQDAKRFQQCDIEKTILDLERAIYDIRFALANEDEERIVEEAYLSVLLKRFINLHAVRNDVRVIREQADKIALLLKKTGGDVVLFSSVEKFYVCSDARDEALLSNLLREMEKRGEQVGVLVAGGYHAEGIMASLKEKNISFVTVLPQLENDDVDVAYASRLNGDILPIAPALSSTFTASLEVLAASGLMPVMLDAGIEMRGDIVTILDIEGEKEKIKSFITSIEKETPEYAAVLAAVLGDEEFLSALPQLDVKQLVSAQQAILKIKKQMIGRQLYGEELINDFFVNIEEAIEARGEKEVSLLADEDYCSRLVNNACVSAVYGALSDNAKEILQDVVQEELAPLGAELAQIDALTDEELLATKVFFIKDKNSPHLNLRFEQIDEDYLINEEVSLLECLMFPTVGDGDIYQLIGAALTLALCGEQSSSLYRALRLFELISRRPDLIVVSSASVRHGGLLYEYMQKARELKEESYRQSEQHAQNFGRTMSQSRVDYIEPVVTRLFALSVLCIDEKTMLPVTEGQKESLRNLSELVDTLRREKKYSEYFETEKVKTQYEWLKKIVEEQCTEDEPLLFEDLTAQLSDNRTLRIVYGSFFENMDIQKNMTKFLEGTFEGKESLVSALNEHIRNKDIPDVPLYLLHGVQKKGYFWNATFAEQQPANVDVQRISLEHLICFPTLGKANVQQLLIPALILTAGFEMKTALSAEDYANVQRVYNILYEMSRLSQDPHVVWFTEAAIFQGGWFDYYMQHIDATDATTTQLLLRFDLCLDPVTKVPVTIEQKRSLKNLYDYIISVLQKNEDWAQYLNKEGNQVRLAEIKALVEEHCSKDENVMKAKAMFNQSLENVSLAQAVAGASGVVDIYQWKPAVAKFSHNNEWKGASRFLRQQDECAREAMPAYKLESEDVENINYASMFIKCGEEMLVTMAPRYDENGIEKPHIDLAEAMGMSVPKILEGQLYMSVVEASLYDEKGLITILAMDKVFKASDIRRIADFLIQAGVPKNKMVDVRIDDLMDETKQILQPLERLVLYGQEEEIQKAKDLNEGLRHSGGCLERGDVVEAQRALIGNAIVIDDRAFPFEDRALANMSLSAMQGIENARVIWLSDVVDSTGRVSEELIEQVAGESARRVLIGFDEEKSKELIPFMNASCFIGDEDSDMRYLYLRSFGVLASMLMIKAGVSDYGNIHSASTLLWGTNSAGPIVLAYLRENIARERNAASFKIAA